MLTFAQPLLLLLIALPILLWFLLPTKTKSSEPGIRLPIAERFKPYQQSAFASASRLQWSQCFGMLLWCLIIIALAGPQWLGPPSATARDGRNIMLALDLSGSMNTPDMQFQGKMNTRIQVVKTVAQTFIHNRPNDRMGLILFGSRAYLQTPLTFDHKNLSAMLADATVGLAGQQTAIGDAIGLAIKRLMHFPKKSRILILLTDGVNNSGNVLPIEAAKVAKKQHIKIYTIGLTGSQMTVQTLFGPRVVDTNQDLDEGTLQAIAQMTGGLFFKAQSGRDLQKVYTTLNRLEKTNAKKQFVRPIDPLYVYPLTLAFLLSLMIALYTIIANKRDKELA